MFTYAGRHRQPPRRHVSGMTVLYVNQALTRSFTVINVGMIRCASCEDTKAQCQTYGLTKIGTTFNGGENFSERACRGVWGHASPRKFSYLKTLKYPFLHSRTDSCVEKVSKIERYFLLNFDKSVLTVISCTIFSKLRISIVTPLLMFAKYDTSFLRRTKKCTV